MGMVIRDPKCGALFGKACRLTGWRDIYLMQIVQALTSLTHGAVLNLPKKKAKLAKLYNH